MTDIMRLGIMGGTFDPIHFGHLECAERAACALALDKVMFMPAGNPHFKLGSNVASAIDRLAMCELACMANPLFQVSDKEIVRAGITYTIDTVIELREELTEDTELYFILGSDALLTLPQWKRSKELASLVRFAVLMRPGDDRAEVERLASAGDYAIDIIECPLLDISSSYLRETVATGGSIRYLTSDAVCQYIWERGLYRADDPLEVEPFVEQDETSEPAASMERAPVDPFSREFLESIRDELATRVSPKRLAHIEGVSDTARRLAHAYGADEEKAALAGLLHDWDKGYDDDEMRQRVVDVGLADVLDPFVVESMPQVLHGPTAAFALKKRYPEIPADVIRAIYYHTTGVKDATDLDKIIYIADAIEPTRSFDTVDELRADVGELSLDELYFNVYRFWTMTLVERGRVLHPDTIPIWNDLAAQRRLARSKPKKKDKKKKEGRKATSGKGKTK